MRELIQKEQFKEVCKENSIVAKCDYVKKEIRCKTEDDFKKSIKFFKGYDVSISYGFYK